MIPPLAERLAYAEANVDELERAAHNYARSTHPESVPTRACLEEAKMWTSVAEALRAELEAAGGMPR
jgi:hypothetical protein